MWLVFVILHIIISVIYSRFYHLSEKKSKNYSALIILLQIIAGLVAILMCPFFKFNFSNNYIIYFLIIINCILYALSDGLYAYVSKNIEPSTFNIIKQISVIFMIVMGLLFFKEPLVWNKIIGSLLIVASNILLFYKKVNQKFNKYVILGIISNLCFAVSLFLDIIISKEFNLSLYIGFVLIISALLIMKKDKIKFIDIKNEIKFNNKLALIITGFCWTLMAIFQLLAYNHGNITIVAPLTDLVVIFSFIIGFIFFKEKDNLIKKIISLLIIIVGVILLLK